MSIRYVCYECSKTLKISGSHAVNEVGRKWCDRCGANGDDLQVVGEDEFNKALKCENKKRG